MNDKTIRINNKLSELAVYLVNKFNMSARDAAGMVMQSSVAEEIGKPDSDMLDWTVEKLAASLA